MRTRFARLVRVSLAMAAMGMVSVAAQQPSLQINAQDILAGLKDPSRWVIYSGDYSGQRHSPLKQITPQNVQRLTAQWSFQGEQSAPGRGFEATPLLVDGILYMTGIDNYAWAIDARSGRPIWRYRRDLPPGLTYCCGPNNKGFAVLGDKLFMSTLDAHLIALNAKTGRVIWDTTVENYKDGYAGTAAPLVIKDKIVVGIAGGDIGIRGFLDAYDAQTGKRVWRFNTVPAPGEPGGDTWPAGAYQRGGASTWTTGSYDPESNLVFWGTSNPGPQMWGEARPGDNLYSDSILAVDADSGKLRWHYQFTPHDNHDWDATQTPIIGEVEIGGQPHKVVMTANRNGFFYTLDRMTGKVLVARPFVETSWANEIGKDGRPIVQNELGDKECLPDKLGASNFMPSSYDPTLKLYFVAARESCATYAYWKPEDIKGQGYRGGATTRAGVTYNAVRAIDPTTGARRWEFRHPPSGDGSLAGGVLSTASGLVFAGDADGNFSALDSKTGKSLWHYQTGGAVKGTAITYMLDGRQYVLIPSGTNLMAFALPTQ